MCWHDTAYWPDCRSDHWTGLEVTVDAKPMLFNNLLENGRLHSRFRRDSHKSEFYRLTAPQ